LLALSGNSFRQFMRVSNNRLCVVVTEVKPHAGVTWRFVSIVASILQRVLGVVQT